MHALIFANLVLFLSTLSLRRATRFRTINNPKINISIHALLAESDPASHLSMCNTSHFYPRSPCGERPYQGKIDKKSRSISIHALLAESDNTIF